MLLIHKLFYFISKLEDLVLQLRVLRGELGRQHDENKKLRSLLDQITKSYKDLQAQLLVAMQKQTQGCRVEQVIHRLSCLTDQLPLH
jgi:uncharacterized membrane protein